MNKEEMAKAALLEMLGAVDDGYDDEDYDNDELWGEIVEDVPSEAVAQIQITSDGLMEGEPVGAIATTLMSIPGVMDINCMPERGLILLNLDTRTLTPDDLWAQIQADETLRPTSIQ